MKQNKTMEQKIQTALIHATPDVWEEVRASCTSQKAASENKMKGTVTAMGEPSKPKKRIWPAFTAAAVLIVAAACILNLQLHSDQKPDAIIAIDVNPSIELTVNQKEQVLQATARNTDAEKILDGMDLKGTDLDIAVNALIGSMLKHGYINDLDNSILVSVESDDNARSAALNQSIVSEINQIFTSSAIEGAVIGQSLQTDAELAQLAEQYQVSFGKAALIQDILEEEPLLSFTDLAALSINDLNLLARQQKTNSERITTGAVSDKAYIGLDQAWQIALTHANLSRDQITVSKQKLDWEDGRMVYEIDFLYQTVEYEYEIDAKNGAIVHYKTDHNDDVILITPETAPQIPSSNTDTGLITSEQAQSIAFQHAGVNAADVRQLDIDYEYSNYWKAYLYELDFHAGNMEYDYKIHSSTGDILSYSQERDDDDIIPLSPQTGTVPPSSAQPNAAQPASQISREKAQSIALQHAGLDASAVTALKVKLDNDDGLTIYEVEFRNGRTEYEYEINAADGSILKQDIDYDD